MLDFVRYRARGDQTESIGGVANNSNDSNDNQDTDNNVNGDDNRRTVATSTTTTTMTTTAALSVDNNSDATMTPVIAILPQICLQGHSRVSRRQARKQRRRVAQRRPSVIDPRRASDQVDTDDAPPPTSALLCLDMSQSDADNRPGRNPQGPRGSKSDPQGDPKLIPKGIQM